MKWLLLVLIALLIVYPWLARRRDRSLSFEQIKQLRGTSAVS